MKGGPTRAFCGAKGGDLMKFLFLCLFYRFSLVCLSVFHLYFHSYFIFISQTNKGKGKTRVKC